MTLQWLLHSRERRRPGKPPASRTALGGTGIRRFVVALLMLKVLNGCVSAPVKAPESAVALPAAFQEQVAHGRRISGEQLSQWWTAWRDPVLQQLVSDALSANMDVRIARSQVAAARSLVTGVESALYPTVAAQGGVWGGESDWRLPQPNAEVAPWLPAVSHGLYGGFGGLGVSWEPDIFGGRRADAAAARALAVGAVESLNGARMTVVADVAENYEEMRGLQLRLAVLDRGIATLERLLDYVEARYQTGQALAYDADRVRERLEAERAGRAPLLTLIEARRRRLAVLTGKPPEAAPPLPSPRPFDVPPPPSGLVPAELLQRRPDVQASAAQVQFWAARLKSARSDLLPRFGIRFLGGDGELHFDGLPNFGATGGLVDLTAYLPLFTAGRIRANIAASDARLDAAIANYDATVLKALEDVENAYRLRSALDRRTAFLAAALAAAHRNESASVALYESGRKTLGDVLDDRLIALNDEDEWVQSQMGQATATVQLYRALGGGW